MAVIPTVTVTSTGARLLSFPRTLSPAATTASSSSLSSLCYLKQGYYPLQRRRILPARKLVIRAARTESKGVSLGFRAPNFELTEPLTGKVWKLDDFEPYPALLVMFICNHCPFVIHLKKDIVKLSNFYMKVGGNLIRFPFFSNFMYCIHSLLSVSSVVEKSRITSRSSSLLQKGLAAVAVSSNSVVTHPQDGPEFMAEEAKLFKYPFPYLYDESQEVAKDFGAVCTPEFFLFKKVMTTRVISESFKDGRRPFELVYHGQFDDSRPSNNAPVTGRDLSLAIDCVLSGQPVSSNQKPSIGCSIKWHPGAKQ